MFDNEQFIMEVSKEESIWNIGKLFSSTYYLVFFNKFKYNLLSYFEYYY